MTAPLLFDSAAFDPAAVTAETRMVNDAILKKLAGLPDQWGFEPRVIRERRAQGLGPFPLAPKSPRARTITIAGKNGRQVPLRIVAPDRPKGVYLHIHGGGWTIGAVDQQDPWLDRIADRAGYACVSVDYGLAPEAPYPHGPDDCESAALWLVTHAQAEFGTTLFAVGGESAGAHLSVVTMLRLRDRHGLTPFSRAVLTAGCYDLAMTPSVRAWGSEKLILNTRDITLFVRHFLMRGGDVTDPDISPIHADLRGLCPALFTVGTRDPLLDDTLFMAPKWLAAGNDAAVNIAPGGCHVFTGFPSTITDQALARIDAFLQSAIA
jgi:acetyl esterase/lipase